MILKINWFLKINIDPKHVFFFGGKSSSKPYLAGSMLIYQRGTPRDFHGDIWEHFRDKPI